MSQKVPAGKCDEKPGFRYGEYRYRCREFGNAMTSCGTPPLYTQPDPSAKLDPMKDANLVNEQYIRRCRTVFSREQLERLEKEFFKENYVSRPRRRQLADQLNLPESTVKVWFQNRRMKDKKQRTAMAWPYSYAPYTDPAFVAGILQAAASAGSLPVPGIASAAYAHSYGSYYSHPSIQRMNAYPTGMMGQPAMPPPSYRPPILHSPTMRLPSRLLPTSASTVGETTQIPRERLGINFKMNRSSFSDTESNGSISQECETGCYRRGIINCGSGRGHPNAHFMPPEDSSPINNKHVAVVYDMSVPKLFKPYKSDVADR